MIEEEPMQRMGRFGARLRNRPTGIRSCIFCGTSNWTPVHKCPPMETNCNKCGKRGHYAKVCRQKYINNGTVKKLTKKQADDRSETSSESNESIHQIKEIKKIEEKNKHYTATVKINEIKKEFIIDTGSPITKMLQGEEILKSTGMQKFTNKQQDKSKNGVKFR